MKPFGSAEEWAQQVIEAEIGEPVHHHDDGSAPSMYDLRIGPVERPSAAIEVTAAADKAWTETWNIGADGDPVTVPGVAGDWVMKIEPKFRYKNLNEQLPPIIAYIQQKGGCPAPTATFGSGEPILRCIRCSPNWGLPASFVRERSAQGAST